MKNLLNNNFLRIIIITIFFLPTQVFGMAGSKCTEQAGSGVIRCGGCRGCRVAVSERNHGENKLLAWNCST